MQFPSLQKASVVECQILCSEYKKFAIRVGFHYTLYNQPKQYVASCWWRTICCFIWIKINKICMDILLQGIKRNNDICWFHFFQRAIHAHAYHLTPIKPFYKMQSSVIILVMEKLSVVVTMQSVYTKKVTIS